MTEKRQPTYDLAAFKAACRRMERLAVTGTALRSAAALGFGRAGIVATIQTMQREYFYNSHDGLCRSPALAGRLSGTLSGWDSVCQVYRGCFN